MQVRVSEAGFVLDPVLERDRQRVAQLGLPVPAREPQGLRLSRRRPALHRGQAEAHRELLSALGERYDNVQAPRTVLKRGEALICRREFRCGAERFQDGDRGLGGVQGLVAAA